MLNLRDFSYLNLLKPECSQVPPDVAIDVQDVQGNSLGSVKAHKFFLSLLSPVLRGIFKENPDLKTIKMIGSSVKSIDTLIRFLYTGDKTLISGLTSVATLFEILVLGEKYQISGSETMIQDRVRVVGISDYEEVFSVLKKCEEVSVVKDIWDTLKKRTIIQLQDRYNSEKEVITFLEKVSGPKSGVSKWMKIKILPYLVFKKKPEYKRPKLELYLVSEEEDDEEEEEEDGYDVNWDKTDESEEDESKTQEKKARKNCTNCKGTNQCSDGERLNELRPGIRVRTKVDSTAYDHELGMRSAIYKGQTGVIKAMYFDADENEFQVRVTWDPWEENEAYYESHTNYVDLELRYKCG